MYIKLQSTIFVKHLYPFFFSRKSNYSLKNASNKICGDSSLGMASILSVFSLGSGLGLGVLSCLLQCFYHARSIFEKFCCAEVA